MDEKEFLLTKANARNVYQWLWWSPLLTIPTMYMLTQAMEGFAENLLRFGCLDFRIRMFCRADFELWAYGMGFLGSAVWHLIFLYRAFLGKVQAFVRWHTRQALILAGWRTLIPLFALTSLGDDFAFLIFFVQVAVWFFGTRWGQGQAEKMDCWLMRRRGMTAELERLSAMDAQFWRTAMESGKIWVDQLMNSKNTFERQQAANQLKNLKTSNDEVTSALEWASHRDINVYVRNAARLALHAPVHQVFLKHRIDSPKEDGAEPDTSELQPQEFSETGTDRLATRQQQKVIQQLVSVFREGNVEQRKLALTQLEILGEVEVF